MKALRRLQVRAGREDVGPHGPADVDQPPRVRVELGHDHQRAVAVAGVQAAGRRAHRVGPLGPVAVDDALGVARGARRVTHHGGGVLVQFGPVVPGGLLGQQLVVAQHVTVQCRRVTVTDHDDVLDLVEVVLDAGQQRDQRVIDDDRLVAAVLDHERQLLGEQADVQRVQHRTLAGHGEVRLDVFLVVPHERGDDVALADAQAVQGLGETFDAFVGVREGHAPGGLALPGHHLAFAVDLRPVPQQLRHGQRARHHRALDHGCSLTSSVGLRPLRVSLRTDGRSAHVPAGRGPTAPHAPPGSCGGSAALEGTTSAATVPREDAAEIAPDDRAEPPQQPWSGRVGTSAGRECTLRGPPCA